MQQAFPKQALPNKQSGLTLLELIITIIIIGILSATILPRFSGSDGYEEYAYRTQAIATLRNIQLRAMQQGGAACIEVLLDNKHLGIPDQNECTASRSFSSDFGDDNAKLSIATEMAIDDSHDVTLAIAGGGSYFRFDRWGIPMDDCAGGCTITITGLDTVQIQIEAEGYIHEML